MAKYYWMKLKDDFFDDDTIRFIEEQEKGVFYINFYLKLCLKSVKNDGKLIRLVGETLIPYDAKSLAKLTNTDYDTVVSAMQLFTQIGLITILESGEIFLNQMAELTGSETDKAKLMREKRARDKLDGNNVTKMLPKCYTEIEKELELENRDKSKSIRHKYGEYQNVLLSDSDIDKLINEFPDDYQERIERLSEYIESTGKKYKNHLATIRSWARKDKNNDNSGKNTRVAEQGKGPEETTSKYRNLHGFKMD